MEKPLQKDPFLPLLTDASPANYYSSNNSKASSGSSLKTRILSLTDTGLRLLNTGRVSEGLGCYTSMFNLLKNLDDSDGSEFQKSFEQSIEELNKIAMRFVQHGDTESGHQVLTFCEETTQPAKYGDFPLPRTTTFNNLACLYRRIGKPKGALNYLRTALTLLNKKNLLHHSATTYLNLSAVHSQLGDHHQALTNAKNALLYAQEELLLYKDDIDTNQEKYKEKVIMLSIAYHNIGSEEEHLKNFNNSLNWYQKAYSVMDEYGIVDEKLYNKFKTGHQTAQDKFLIMNLKSTSRGVSPQSNRRAYTPDRSFDSSRGVSPKNAFGEFIKPIGFDVRHHASPTSSTGFMFKEKKIVNRKRSKKSVPKPIILHSGIRHTDRPPLSASHRRSGSSSNLKPKMKPLFKTVGVPSSKSSKHFSPNPHQAHHMTTPPSQKMDHSLSEADRSPSYGFHSPNSRHYGTDRYGMDRSPQDEIKALEEAGVLEWSDTEKKSKRKKQEKAEIKKNQTNFITQLKEAGVKVISGEVRLIDSSDQSSSSSSSSSSDEDASIEKSRKKSSQKKKKRYTSEVSHNSQQPPRQASDQIEEDDAIKLVDEDIVDDFVSDNLSNASKKSKKNSKSQSKIEQQKESALNTSQKKSMVSGIGLVGKGMVSDIFTKSFLAKDASSQSLNSVRSEKSTRSGKSTKSGKSKKKIEYTKEELEQMSVMRGQAALVIQKNYRGKLARDKYKLMQEREVKMAGKYLVKKKFIILEPYKAEDKQNIKQEPRDYYLSAFAYPQNEMLHFNLTDCNDKLKYYAEVSYKDVPVKKTKRITYPYNLRLLDELCEETIPKFLIIDHLLYINKTKLNQESPNKKKHVTFDLNESMQSDPGPEPTQYIPINMKQHGKEIIKIQSHMRGKLARDDFKLLQGRRWRFLFVHTFKQDEQLITFRLIQRLDQDKYYATALHLLKNRPFNRLEIPEILVASLRKQYVNLISKIEFDQEHMNMNFLPAVEVKLFPETRQKHIKRIEDTTVIKIQKHIRRYLAQSFFKLRLQKHRRNPTTHLLRKYPLVEGRHLFTVRVFYKQDEKIISVTAKSEDYISEIRPLILSIREVDRHQFSDTLANLRRLADIISPYITMEYNKHDTYVLGFDKREFERNGRRLEAQLQSYTDLDILGLHESLENGEETRTKVWQYLQDKSFIEANKHILLNVLGLQGIRQTIKIIEDQEPSIKNLGDHENIAARKIQKFYRRILLQRYLKNQSEGPKQISIKDSASLILANSIRGRSYSMFCEAYKRMIITEEELRRQSTSDRLFLKTIPTIHFSNTNLEARAHVFQNKGVGKDKTFDVEVIVPIIGLHDNLLINESDLSNTALKPAVLIKKIDELLINRLGYNPVTKRVYFSKDLVNNKGSDDSPVHKLKISPYIQAKMTRLKYLRRRARTKDMALINMQTVEVDRTYINMSYYWYQPRRQMRVMVEQIDALTHYKEIIIKFDNIQTESEFRGLINDMNTETKEFIEKMKPYLKYIASHIVLQPETKVRNVANPREFKILMDGSIFNLEFANTRFVLASLKDIPVETLNSIVQKSQIVDIKFLLRSNKLVDIQQFEKIFNNKINIDDILGDKKEESKIKRDSEQVVGGDSKIPTLNMDSLFMKDMANHQEAQPSKKKITMAELETAAQMIQKGFRRYKDQDKFKILKLSKELGKKALEGYGKKINKTVKKIDNHYWIIHVYKKVQAEKNLTMYYFSAVSVREGPGIPKTTAKGIYRADNMQLINSAGKGLVDFLIERIEINGQTIEFNLNLDQTNNYVKIETPEPKIVQKQQEEDEVQYHSNSAGNSARSFTEDKSDEVGTNSAAPDNKTRKVPKIAIKPHNRSSKKLQTIKEEGGEGKTPGEPGEEQKETPTPTPAVENTLLQQKAESLLNTLLLYNVYYNQDEEGGESADQQTLKPQDGITSPTGENAENVIKISVEMEELKKYVPNLSVKSSQDLKVIAAELANSIQINEKGEVLVNHTKINPNALSITEKKLSIQENQDTKPNKDKNSKKKVLFKMTKAYGDKKYLVLINYIEKLSTINGVMSIAGREEDKVYEDFELFIEVSAVCLSHSSIKPLVWELALQEAHKLSGMTNTAKIAKFFANNIHVFGDQLLLSTPFNYYVNEKNVMIMNENAIKMIQNRFRTRKFTKNFIKFKETLITLKPKNPERAVINLNNVSYNVMGYEKAPGELEILTWDLTNYEKHSIIVKRSLIEKIYMKDKRRAFHYIFKFLTFEFNAKKEYTLTLRERNMMDYLQKEGEM